MHKFVTIGIKLWHAGRSSRACCSRSVHVSLRWVTSTQRRENVAHVAPISANCPTNQSDTQLVAPPTSRPTQPINESRRH